MCTITSFSHAMKIQFLFPVSPIPRGLLLPVNCRLFIGSYNFDVKRWTLGDILFQTANLEDYFHISKNVLIKQQTWGHWCCLPKRTGEFLPMSHYLLRWDQFWDSDPISLPDHQSKNLPWIAITWLRLPLQLHCVH